MSLKLSYIFEIDIGQNHTAAPRKNILLGRGSLGLINSRVTHYNQSIIQYSSLPPQTKIKDARKSNLRLRMFLRQVLLTLPNIADMNEAFFLPWPDLIPILLATLMKYEVFHDLENSSLL